MSRQTGSLLASAALVAVGLALPFQSAAQQADVERPGAPPFVQTAMRSVDSATVLTWGRSTDNVGVVDYAVYRNGTEIARTGSPGRQIVLDQLPHGSSFLQVRGIDAAGNASVKTRPIVVLTDRVAPAAPRNVEITFDRFFTDDVPRAALTVIADWPRDPGGIAAVEVLRNGQIVDRQEIGLPAPDEQRERLRVDVLPASGRQWYQLRFIDTSGNTSARSAPASIVFGAEEAEPPSAVADLALELTPDGDSIIATWAPASDNVAVTDYVVRQQAMADGDLVGPRSVVGVVSGDVREFTFDSPQAGTVSVSVVAVDANVLSGPATSASIVVPVTDRLAVPRPAPATIRFFDDPSRLVGFFGTDLPGESIVGFQVFVDGEFWSETSTSSVDLSGLPAGPSLVTARSIGESGRLSVASEPVVVTGLIHFAPAAPVRPMYVVNDGAIDLRWTTNNRELVGYKVIRSDQPATGQIVQPDVIANDVPGDIFDNAGRLEPYGNHLVLDDFAPGTHTVRLIAVGTTGLESGPSTPITFTLR